MAKSQTVRLSSQQRECVEFRPDGALLVRGIPGSGKTTVLMARASWLMKNGKRATDGPLVHVLTYNKALANYVRQLSLKVDSDPVQASTFHQWGSQLLRTVCGIPVSVVDVRERLDKVQYAKNIVRKNNSGAVFPNISADKELVDFLSSEIQWIKGQGISTKPEYLDAQRTGRGNQVQILKKHRETIFDVYEKYQQLLKNYGKSDFDDVALLLLKHADKIVRYNMMPSHILIDEAQDLTSAQLKAIGKLAAVSLTIAADKGQKIYRRQFTWRSVGIDIHSSRSKFLNNSFRSTKQIIQLARSLQEYDHLLKKDDEYVPASDPEASGPLPELYFSRDDVDELRNVVGITSKIWSSFRSDTIAVIANSNDRMKEFAEAFDRAKIPRSFVKEEDADIFSPGVKLVSFYSAKGLEFDHVIVTGLREGWVPYKFIEAGCDEDDFMATELRKLFVAMTRARLTLSLSAVQPVSPFVNLLDKKLYMYGNLDHAQGSASAPIQKNNDGKTEDRLVVRCAWCHTPQSTPAKETADIKCVRCDCFFTYTAKKMNSKWTTVKSNRF